MSGMFVRCPECGEKHNTDKVEHVDFWEGDRGQDVMSFYCPITKNLTESNVYRGGWDGEE